MSVVTPGCVKPPGYLPPSTGLDFGDVLKDLAATGKLPAEVWLQRVALCGFYESVVNEPNAS